MCIRDLWCYLSVLHYEERHVEAEAPSVKAEYICPFRYTVWKGPMELWIWNCRLVSVDRTIIHYQLLSVYTRIRSRLRRRVGWELELCAPYFCPGGQGPLAGLEPEVVRTPLHDTAAISRRSTSSRSYFVRVSLYPGFFSAFEASFPVHF